MPAKKQNRVIIRIWDSNIKQVLTGQVSKEERQVGHISIQTPNKNMSLWPENPPQTHFEEFFGIQQKDFVLTPEQDVKYESEWDNKGNIIKLQPPSTIICLYSLDVKAIEARFNEIHSDPEFKGWTLLGNNLLLNKGKAHSCASLAYTLLKAGGIYELLSFLDSSTGGLSSSASPAALATITNKAKQAELAKYPDTKKFELFERISHVEVKNSKGKVNKYQYTEKETKPALKLQNSYCNCTSLAISVGFFAIGAAAVIYKDMCPESVSDYCESLKPYLPFP